MGRVNNDVTKTGSSPAPTERLVPSGEVATTAGETGSAPVDPRFNLGSGALKDFGKKLEAGPVRNVTPIFGSIGDPVGRAKAEAVLKAMADLLLR